MCLLYHCNTNSQRSSGGCQVAKLNSSISTGSSDRAPKKCWDGAGFVVSACHARKMGFYSSTNSHEGEIYNRCVAPQLVTKVCSSLLTLKMRNLALTHICWQLDELQQTGNVRLISTVIHNEEKRLRKEYISGLCTVRLSWVLCEVHFALWIMHYSYFIGTGGLHGRIHCVVFSFSPV